LTICEDALVDCENEVITLENTIVALVDALDNCSLDDDFLIYWSGALLKVDDGIGGACFTFNTWDALSGEAIYLNPNICTPTPDCVLHGNFCYCITVNNLNVSCPGTFSVLIPNCGFVINTTGLFGINTRSAWDFSGHETFLKSEITNFGGPGDLFEFVCEATTFSGGYYNHWRYYKINQAMWYMVSTVTAEITFENTIDFVDSIPPKTLVRKTVMYIN